jgi:hypothetical protein
MRRLVLVTALFLSAGAARADHIGVSLTLGEPGFYGQINIGSAAPPPQVIYSQPVVVQPAPEYVSAPPLYLHVPEGYERHWRRHCGEYNACGRRVFFVRHDWYQNVYVPHYQREHVGEGREHAEWHEHAREHGDHGHDHGRDHEDRDH